MYNYKICKFKEENLEDLVSLSSEFFKEQYKKNHIPLIEQNRIKNDLENGFKKRLYECLLAKKEDKIVGYSLFEYKQKNHKILKIANILESYVLPEHRGNLIGLNLLALTLRYLKLRGCKSVFAEIKNDNKKVLFKDIKFFKFNVYKTDKDYILIKKKL